MFFRYSKQHVLLFDKIKINLLIVIIVVTLFSILLKLVFYLLLLRLSVN